MGMSKDDFKTVYRIVPTKEMEQFDLAEALHDLIERALRADMSKKDIAEVMLDYKDLIDWIERNMDNKNDGPDLR